MLDGVSARTFDYPTGNVVPAGKPRRRVDVLAESAILVLGSPRSGTTWLAKIFDSHPDILYRHEPDELTPWYPRLDPAEQMRLWLRERGLRSAVKRPLFAKSWRPLPLAAIRTAIATTLAVSAKVPIGARLLAGAGVPDLVAIHQWGRVRAAIKLVNWDGRDVLRQLPGCRCVFILRHPCGQVASTLAGLSERRFARADQAAATPIDLRQAAALAASRGVSGAAFAALPEAAKLAWVWLAFNEPAVAALETLPNARLVLYEDLCDAPEAMSRALFDFAGLDWPAQTVDFLASSTRNQRAAGYYDVFRSTKQVADRWRTSMSGADQESVRAVIRPSTLAHLWGDLR